MGRMRLYIFIREPDSRVDLPMMISTFLPAGGQAAKLKPAALLLLFSLFSSSLLSAQVTESARIKALKTELSHSEGVDKIRLLNEICDEFESFIPDSSLNYATRALLLSEEAGSKEGMINSLNNIGHYYNIKADAEKSLEYFNKSISIAREIGNKQLEAYCLNFIARVQFSLVNYPGAIDYYLQSLVLREQLGDSSGIALIHGNLGNLYRTTKDYESAEKHLLKALELNISFGDTSRFLTDYLNLGVLSHNMNKLDKAREYDEKGIFFAEKMNDLQSLSIILGNYAMIFADQGDFPKALDYLGRSLKLKEEVIKQPASTVHAYAKYQQLYLNYDFYQKSIDSGEKTMELLARYPNRDMEQKVLKRLAEAHSALGRYKEGYEYMLQSEAMKDSVFDQEKSHQVKQLNAIYETNKKDVTIARQDGEIKLISAASLFKTRLAWAIGLGMLSLFGSAYLFRSRKFALNAKLMQERFSRQLLSSHEEERKRVARDLHDSVGQSLILIKNKVALNQDDTTASMVSRALEEVRTISKALHPAVLDRLGLTASIQKLVNDADEVTDIFFTEEIESIDNIFSREHELQIYRIVQETLNNLIKHSQTESALVRVNQEERKVTVTVQDYGVGFDLTEKPDTIHSLGMKTLKERTQLVGGKILIEATKGKGTSVTLVIDKPA
ncbi:MAG: tetratricopeptide repeat protein [Imperialibacter sp.]|uniref:tetratricopeptide repeat-containing sensor histidine kinase n=1 Tax=Imperialibacter sp. TaxID=2038411 RepID=UPI003A894B5D